VPGREILTKPQLVAMKSKLLVDIATTFLPAMELSRHRSLEQLKSAKLVAEVEAVALAEAVAVVVK
jgi:hypothetical protein